MLILFVQKDHQTPSQYYAMMRFHAAVKLRYFLVPFVGLPLARSEDLRGQRGYSHLTAVGSAPVYHSVRIVELAMTGNRANDAPEINNASSSNIVRQRMAMNSYFRDLVA